MYDILIRGGEVVDGTGAPRVRADVAIRAGRVAAVGALPEARAATVLDATGCVVSPGFVDMHSHADGALLALPTADSLLQQGITTAVVGQCGSTPVPILPATREAFVSRERSDVVPMPWERLSTYRSFLDLLQERGTALNVVPLVGLATVRIAVMGYSSAPATGAQVAEMQALVAQAMDEGAVGVSTGLIYPPGSYASTQEIVAVTRPAGERGGFYFSHIRGEADTLLEAVSEAIHIGRETGAAVEVSHFKAAGQVNWPKATRALDLIEAARAEGLNVAADMYPYLAGSSSLASMLPEWAQEGGLDATLARLKDPATRERMSRDMERVGFFRGADWSKVLIADSPRRPAIEGRYVADLAREASQHPHEWVFDTLLETGLQVQMITHYACEENLERQLRRPWMVIGTDASGVAATGPLSGGYPHPRHYGTFPRVLGRYARERGVLTPEEAVHRMTGLPAERLRWQDRGHVAEGQAADIVVFDPATIADTATYESPHRYPVGIRAVLVNGEVVVRDGAHTGALPGRVLGR